MTHLHLECGIELAVAPMPARNVVAIEIRVLAGYAFEQSEYLGVAHVMTEAIGKGTARRDGRALNDAFDAIGAAHDSYCGRETVGFSCLCLPEFIEQAIELHAEMIRTPSFPEDACEVAVELAHQELAALDDDPDELAKKLLHRQSYNEPLGRHPLGEKETLDRIGREQIRRHWMNHFSAHRMQVAIAGNIEPGRASDLLEKHFAGFGDRQGQFQADSAGPGGLPLPAIPFHFSAGHQHYDKDLDQIHITMCFPGAAITDGDFAIQQVTVGVLSGGTSSRLFTEVREKQGLVYWVGAWTDYPRGAGIVHVGASSTPDKAEQTCTMLLREINRLRHDLSEDEVQRAITGIVTQAHTRGDVTRSWAARFAEDLFHHGRPVPLEEKIARIQAVTIDDIHRYLDRHPRDKLGMVTLGPRSLIPFGDGGKTIHWRGQ